MYTYDIYQSKAKGKVKKAWYHPFKSTGRGFRVQAESFLLGASMSRLDKGSTEWRARSQWVHCGVTGSFTPHLPLFSQTHTPIMTQRTRVHTGYGSLWAFVLYQIMATINSNFSTIFPFPLCMFTKGCVYIPCIIWNTGIYTQWSSDFKLLTDHKIKPTWRPQCILLFFRSVVIECGFTVVWTSLSLSLSLSQLSSEGL